MPSRRQQPTARKGTALPGFWEGKTPPSSPGTGVRLSGRDAAPEAPPVPWEDGALPTVSHTSHPQSGVKAARGDGRRGSLGDRGLVTVPIPPGETRDPLGLCWLSQQPGAGKTPQPSLRQEGSGLILHQDRTAALLAYFFICLNFLWLVLGCSITSSFQRAEVWWDTAAPLAG